MIHRRSGGASEHNACCVVGAIDEAAAGPLDVLDVGVVGFYFACGGAGDDGDFALFPTATDGPPESVRLGLIGFLYELYLGGLTLASLSRSHADNTQNPENQLTPTPLRDEGPVNSP